METATQVAEPLSDLSLLWLPPERLSLSAWAERHFILSPEYSAKVGLITLDPWQREIFDAFTDPAVEEISLMVGTQLIKTLFLQVAATYAICEDPGPILFVGYSDSDAEKYSKERFGPMIRDIPELHARISPAKSRDPDNTIQHKLFPGGTIDFVGSKSPANLARRTIRYLFFDEIDKYDRSSGTEGDPIALGKRRTVRFGSRRKIIMTCSPTVRGTSRIGAAYEESDQRKPYVSCHACGHAQILTWPNVIFDSSLSIVDAAAGARYRCEKCGALWTESDRRQNIRDSVTWKPHAPFTGKAGFWISHLYSTLQLHSLSELTSEFLDAVRSGKKERLQVFLNTDLAELWEEAGERPDWELLYSRAEDYDIGVEATLPAGVVFLTAGVDVQARRLEMQVLGYGEVRNGESIEVHTWVVDYQVIELFESNGVGKMTEAPEFWIELRRLFERRYRHAAGVELPIITMSIDVGHNPDPVYKFAHGAPQPVYGPAGLIVSSPGTVLCVRGYDSEHLNAIHRVTERETARQRKGAGQDLPIITLGTGYLKTDLYSELMGRGDQAQRIHLSARLDKSYFRGLVAEKRIVSAKTGDVTWEKVYPRNEPLDTWVYARGGFAAMRADRFTSEQWNLLRKKFGLPTTGEAPSKLKKRPAGTYTSPYLDNEHDEDY